MARLAAIDRADIRASVRADGGVDTVFAAGPVAADWRWRLAMTRAEPGAPCAGPTDAERLLVPLDADLLLDAGERRAPRLGVMRLAAGDPARVAAHADPTRVFSLALRGGARAELLARPLLGSMLLFAVPGESWFVYPVAGRATLRSADAALTLEAHAPAWVAFTLDSGERAMLEGSGEIVLARLAADEPTDQ
ncbi:MAG TPA: HutD family protein [Mizugakiibacter sp.]